MERLKGLILSGGKGTRLRPITHTSAKQLVPVANKPVLFYGIEAMAEAGIEDVGIIIAPETGGEIEAAAGDGSRFGVRVTYVLQDEPLGLAHAVLTAEEFLGADPFVMYLGDNLLQGGISDLVAAFREHEPDALILLTPVPDPQNYGVAELDAEPGSSSPGRVRRLVEKPSEPASDLALVGVYMFTAGIHDAARAISPSARGELEITDAIQHLVDSGRRVEPHIVRGWWKDTGRLEDMLEANRLILDNLVGRVDGELLDSHLDGRVVVEAGARLERTRVRGPAVIGAGATLKDCYIGPYTAIGAGCEISDAEVEHSILLAGCTGLRAGRAHGVLAARAQRHGPPRRAPAARVPLHGRRQLRHLDPVRLLVTGAGGMLAHDVARAGERAGFELALLERGDLDIADEAAVRAMVEREQGRGLDALVNCAAWTDVDGAESDPDAARAVERGRGRHPRSRRRGRRRRAAARLDRLRVRRPRPRRSRRPATRVRRERSDGAAVGLRRDQARRRAAGARAPPRATPSSARPGCTGSTAGASPRRCCALAAERDAVQVVTDQVGSPTWSGHLAPALLGLLERGVRGLVHLGGGGHVSWHGFAEEIFRQAEIDCRVEPVSSEQFARPAPRPAWSALESGREDVIPLPPWQDGLAGYLASRAGMIRG